MGGARGALMLYLNHHLPPQGGFLMPVRSHSPLPIKVQYIYGGTILIEKVIIKE